MSFQDVGKKRQHPIFDKHRLSVSSSPRNHPVESRNKRTSTSTSTSATSNRNNSRTGATTSTTSTSTHIPDVTALGNHSSSSSSKSVRPRLSTSCPVTKRNLLRVEDDKSQLSGSTTTTTASEVSEEEDVMEDPVVRRKKYSPASHSLTNELQQFQKMVSELEHVFAQASSSPEAQWKSRILVRSVQDVDRDLGTKVYQVQSRDQTLEARKWMRDYIRMHKELQGLLQKQLRQQQADISLLTAGHGRNNEHQKVMQEEYFDRIMREREQEVQQIQFSMDQVNAIYQDLAAMVDGQQDQIDLLADRAEESKAYTESGLEQIQEAMMGWCSPDTTATTTNSSNRNHGMGDESNGYSPTRRNRQPLHSNGGGMETQTQPQMQNHWVVLNPNTLQDIQVLKQGVMDKGQAMMDEIQDTVMDYSTCQCLSDNTTTEVPPNPKTTRFPTTTTAASPSRTYEYTVPASPRARSSSRGRENREPTRRSSSRSRRSY